MFDSLVSQIPPSIRHESGAVFNSGRAAFSSPKKLYILGLNPGGAPEDHREQTVDFHTKKVLSKDHDWSEFRDEPWDGLKPGTHRLQKRVLHVLAGLGLDPGSVPTSNLVFKRTRNAAGLGKAQLDALATESWPFHASLIDKLEVRVILCLGQDAGNWLREKVQANELIDEFVESNNRRWKSQAFKNSQGLTVIVAAHPSWSAWNYPASDITPLVRRCLDR